MKQVTLVIAFLLTCAVSIQAQYVPSGMKYQAVARNLAGEVMANQTLTLQISLQSQSGKAGVHYVETHNVVTNTLGLFDLVIGEGTVTQGNFKQVPWSTEDIWMQVAIKDKANVGFSTISNSRLLAVPYAFHAATASELVSKGAMKEQSSAAPVNSLEDPIDKCNAKKGIALMRLLYLGPNGVQVKVYQDNRLQKLITTINGLNNGDIFLVDARTSPEKKFKNETYFVVSDRTVPLTVIPTKGEPGIVAETYGNFSVMSVMVVKDKDSNGEECTACDMKQEWKAGGNVTQELCSILGTLNNTDLILITNNVERLRIKATGDINIKNNLQINNSLNIVNNADIGNDLTVKNNVKLNTTGGTTIINGPTTVDKLSPTVLTGTLQVDKATELKSTLVADGIARFTNPAQSTTPGDGSVIVAGGAGIAKNLNVGGNTIFSGGTSFSGGAVITDVTQSTLSSNGALIVAGGAGIGKNLNIGGLANLAGDFNINTNKFTVNAATGNTNVAGTFGVAGVFNAKETSIFDKTIQVKGTALFDQAVTLNSSMAAKSLNISSDNPEFVATFQNLNNGNGDGIKIKLGKTHPRWNGSYVGLNNYPVDQFDNQIAAVKGWIKDGSSFRMQDIASLSPNSFLLGTSISVANLVSEKINSALNLPIYIGPYSVPAVNMPAVTMPAVELPALSTPSIDLGLIDLPSLNIIGKTTLFPQTNIFPATTLLPETQILPRFPVVPAIPPIPNVFPTLDLKVPNLVVTDVANSLNKENEFIRFTDKDDRKLGAIRAQSISDFASDYYDGVYLVNVMTSLVGIDLLGGFMGGIREVTNLIDSYNNIGVEYSSGHGDYAEWLPRINQEELITTGDIVGVKGGKITKDLAGAEQVMAVSHRPIMLGNAPKSENEQLGNKIAFLGQIPVKVIGAVNVGDFIVGKSEVPGYGIAVNPAKVTPEDLSLSVGRAWESNNNEGPKMVNTLIGIQNGDYLNILKRSQDKIETMEARLNALEEKMNAVNVKTGRK